MEGTVSTPAVATVVPFDLFRHLINPLIDVYVLAGVGYPRLAGLAASSIAAESMYVLA